jgi:hypothetical protein
MIAILIMGSILWMIGIVGLWNDTEKETKAGKSRFWLVVKLGISKESPSKTFFSGIQMLGLTWIIMGLAFSIADRFLNFGDSGVLILLVILFAPPFVFIKTINSVTHHRN